MKKFAILGLIFTLCACITKEYRGGVPIRPRQMEQIQDAKSKKDVVEILGSPAATNFVGPEKWYYYTSEGEIWAFLDPKFSKYEILTISFDSSDDIKEIKLSNLAEKDFAQNEDEKTNLPSDIKLGFFAELFGNIGRFNAAGTSGNQ
ncbi:MAG: outer membrane protein assembly factor BamE [bacterium]|nr:outer membrane protein assembly factor BamE [bacterium]